MSEGFWLSDAQWQRLAPLLPNKSRGVKRVDDRRVISGIVHVLRSGGRWTDAPCTYGPRKTLYNRSSVGRPKGSGRICSTPLLLQEAHQPSCCSTAPMCARTAAPRAAKGGAQSDAGHQPGQAHD